MQVRLARSQGREIAVREASSEALPGAWILLHPGDWPLGATDEEGRFELPATAGVTVFTVGGEDGRFQRFDLADASASVTVGPGRWVRGRVIGAHDGRAVAGAWVWPADRGAGVVRSGESGVFALWQAPAEDAGSVLPYRVAAPGYLPHADSRPLAAGRASPTVLELEPAAAVAGRVVDAAGLPLPGVELRAHSFQGRRADRSTLSDADGRFHLGLLQPHRDYRIELVREDLRRAALDVPPLDPFMIRHGLRVVMGPASLLLGQVVGPGDRPVVGAAVELGTSTLDREGTPPGKIGSDDAEELETDETGRFTATVTGSGLIDVEVRAEGFAPLALRGLEVSADADRLDLGRLVLEPAAVIYGRVVDPEDRPIEGVEVYDFSNGFEQLDDLPRYLRFRRPAATSVSDGRFRLDELPAGSSVQLILKRPGFSLALLRGVVAPSERELRVVMAPAGSVAGRVLDAGGLGVRAQVYLRGGGPRTTAARVTTDPDGEFRFADVGAGPLELWARVLGFPPARVSGLEVAPPDALEGIEIRLARGAARGATLSGRVLDPEGRPVPRAAVRGRLPGPAELEVPAEHRGTTTDELGAYRLDGLPPGTWQLLASRNLVEVAQELEIGEADQLLDFVLGAGGKPVAGSVTDELGAAVPGVLLLLTPEAGGRPRPAVSGVDGSFVFDAVPLGTYHLATGISGERVEVPVALIDDPGPIAVSDAPEEPVPPLDVRVGVGATLAGRVSGIEPQLLDAVEISATGERAVHGRSHVRLDSWGEYEIPRLDFGHWTVTATLPGTGRRARGQVRIEPGVRRAVLDLDFRAGLSLGGSVLADGEPVAGVKVGVTEPSGGRVEARTDYQGRFLFQGLDSGPHRLEVQVTGPLDTVVEDVELWSDRELLIELD